MCFHHLTQNQVFIHIANFNQMFILLDWRKKYLLCILTSMFSGGLDNYRDWKTGDGCWTSHTIHFLLPLLTSKLSCKHMLLRLSDASVLRCSATYILWRAPPQKCNYSTHQGFRSMWGGAAELWLTFLSSILLKIWKTLNRLKRGYFSFIAVFSDLFVFSYQANPFAPFLPVLALLWHWVWNSKHH